MYFLLKASPGNAERHQWHVSAALELALLLRSHPAMSNMHYHILLLAPAPHTQSLSFPAGDGPGIFVTHVPLLHADQGFSECYALVQISL